MSLQWSIVAGFLYSEIVVLIILLLPIISPQRWNRIFRSKILHSLGTQTALYFYGLFGLLALLFLDAIREMRKYSSEEYDLNTNPKAEMQAHMKLFRAQRNFYISGFALLLSAIIRRLTTLLSAQAQLMAENEAALKQAANASKAASAIIDSQTSSGSGKKSGDDGDAAKFQKEVKALKEELAASLRDKDVLKSQADNTNKEYDRLLKEHEKLQKKLSIAGGDKKDD
ncbi:B-cell receptor-associated protein 31 [Orchesella cincta]|uniref:Endoplasmic reticulum transmembrane protein n=1 Tax=Orchesella cincta TaxID=48709 RepID=A0A1D2MYG5_ORCCI|nr:B-cell receptor-associated protein 31 [Orchesella cincta]